MELTLTVFSFVITADDPPSSQKKANYFFLFEFIHIFINLGTLFIHSASPYYLRHSV